MKTSAVCSILLCLIIFFGSIFERYNLSQDGPKVEVVNSCNMSPDVPNVGYFNKIGDVDDKIIGITSLKKGDSIKILGYRHEDDQLFYLAETDYGARGWIYGLNVGIPLMPLSGDYKGQTINVSFEKNKNNGYYKALLEDGSELFDILSEEGETTLYPKAVKAVKPIFEDSEDFILSKEANTFVCSRKAFEKNVIGKTQAEIERKYGSAMVKSYQDGGFIIRMDAVKVYDIDFADSAACLKPYIFFANNNVASKILYTYYSDGHQAKYLMDIPFASLIIDCPLTSFLVRTSIYEPIEPAKYRLGILNKCIVLLYKCTIWGFSLFWFFCPSMILPLILIALLYFPFMRRFSNKLIKIVVIVLTLIPTYYWTTISLVWNANILWTICVLLLNSVSVFWMIGFSVWNRCPKCRCMQTIREYDRVHTGDSYHEFERKGGKRCVEKTHISTKITTWTDRYGDKTEARYKNFRLVYEIPYYIDTKKFRHYKCFYECVSCGFKYTGTTCDSEVVDTKYVGSTYSTEYSQESDD